MDGALRFHYGRWDWALLVVRVMNIIERLRSNEILPVCPYDRRSPDYWTTDDDAPCVICGTLNDSSTPDLCRGADTRVMAEAADAIAELIDALQRLRKGLDVVDPGRPLQYAQAMDVMRKFADAAVAKVTETPAASPDNPGPINTPAGIEAVGGSNGDPRS